MSTPTMTCHRCKTPMPLAETKFEGGLRILTCPSCQCEHRWLVGQAVIDLRDGVDSVDISDTQQEQPESTRDEG